MDTYTNLCFFSLVIHNISQIPTYIVIISSVSILATIITKLGFIINLGFFTLYTYKSSKLMASTLSETKKASLNKST